MKKKPTLEDIMVAVEKSCHRNDVLCLDEVKIEAMGILVGATLLEQVAAGKMEITNFRNGQLVFNDSK